MDNNLTGTIVLLLLTGVASFVLTGLLRQYALTKSLLDIPNYRSSHSVPTPRGGGIAVVLSFLGALPVLTIIGGLQFMSLVALFGAGALVALVGFLDDLGHIPASWRLLAHFIGAAWALVWLGGIPVLPVFGYMWDLDLVGQALIVVYLVWMLNLYNFMDGIDGIAGIEAITVCLGGAILFALSPASGSEWALPMLLLTAVAGFLYWNFPKAKVFMGDAGSGFVGITLGVMSIQAYRVAPDLFWGWVILFGAFVVDATVTLVRRVRRGDKFYEAHRTHAYQYAARKYGTHWPVSLGFGMINLLWLLPIASIVVTGRLDGVLGVVVAYIPLIFLAFWFKAGVREV